MRDSYNLKSTPRADATDTVVTLDAPRWLLVTSTALLVIAAGLGGVALASTSYLTTSQFAPFFDDVAPSPAVTTETRVGAFEICYEIVGDDLPSTAASKLPSERCFSYRRDSPVLARNTQDVAYYASACTIATRARRGEGVAALDAVLTPMLGMLCGAERTTGVALAAVSLTAALVGALAMLDALSSTNPNVPLRLNIALVVATLGAACALTAYLSWVTVIRSDRHVLQQGASAWLTLASTGAFVGAAIAIGESRRQLAPVEEQFDARGRATAVIL